MTILHITPSYKPAYHYGGPTISVSRLCETLSILGHKVEVKTTTANGKIELETATGVPRSIDGVSVFYFKRWTGDHSHFSPTLLHSIWRNCRRFDAVHIHSWWNLVAVLALGICLLRRIQPVLSLRGMLSLYTLRSQPKRLFHRFIGKYMLAKAILHVTSAEEASGVSQLVPGARLFCIPNVLELPPVLSEKSAVRDWSQTKTAHLVFLGRLHPVKRLELLLDALPLLPSPCRLTIAGAGDAAYAARLRERATRLGLDPFIEWPGWVEGAEKYRILASADVFVLTSYNENFANAALEALLLGTPVVLTETVGLAEYVVQTGFGRVCPPEAGAIAGAIAELLRTGTATERSARAARARVDFHPERLAQAYVEQYKKLVLNPTCP